MAKRPNLGQITSSVFTVSQLNTAYDKIDTAFDNTLSRDGSTPNTMLADLDMNSNDILNVGVLDGDQINVNEAYIGGKLFTGTLTWRSDWLTATSYQELDLVKQNGNVYVALEEHTSGVFASDLSALRWELFVENATGPAGPTGDTGATGPAGQGVPTGGTTGQVLAKVDGTNYNTEWVDQTGGAGVTDGDKGDITVSGSGSTWTIDDGAVTLAKQADMATASLVYRKTAGSGAPEVNTLTTLKTDLGLTGTNSGDQTSIVGITGTKAQFDTAVTDGNFLYVGDVTSNATHTGEVTGSTALTIDPTAITGKSAVTAVGTDYVLISDTSDSGNLKKALVSDFTSGGGSPGGSSGEVQYNNGGAFAGAVDVEIEGGQLRLPSISTPSAPSASGIKLFGKNWGLAPWPNIIGPSSLQPWPMAPFIGEGRFHIWMPAISGSTVSVFGWPGASTQGTATGSVPGVGNRRTNLQRIEYLVGTPSTSAVAGWRVNAAGFPINGSSSWEGGFYGLMHGGGCTGQTNSSARFFMGLGDTGSSSDVDPSSLLVIVGIGYDAADSNMQFMHNDGSGTATKVDLGSSFAKPSSDRSTIYRLRLYAPPGTSRSLSYEVTELESGAVATGTVTTNLPDTSSYVTPKMYASVGGVSAVTGITVGNMTFITEPF